MTILSLAAGAGSRRPALVPPSVHATSPKTASLNRDLSHTSFNASPDSAVRRQLAAAHKQRLIARAVL
jgi:hypothetical protein